MGSARCCEKPRFFVPFTRVLRVRADGTFVIHRHVIEHDLAEFPRRAGGAADPHHGIHRMFHEDRLNTYDGPLAA